MTDKTVTTDKRQLISELRRLQEQLKTCASLIKNIYGKEGENAKQLMGARRMVRQWNVAINKEHQAKQKTESTK